MGKKLGKKTPKKLHTFDLKTKEKIEELFGDADRRQKKYISWLYELATRDEKTGLYNNKFFESILGMEMEKAQRGYGELCLFIIDIDFFKKIRDNAVFKDLDSLKTQLEKDLLVVIDYFKIRSSK